ncbi:MAG: hypothetical protein GVY13_03500 [Alphaproteobacteria bacterium]|jgi:hypothetical protein|nr:hypothetical protein [Alphaproteobacteria bacterium]
MTRLATLLPLEITLVAPFASHGLQAGRVGVDVALARNAAGDLVLPGTLLAGIVRAALIEVAQDVPDATLTLPDGPLDVGEACRALFGQPSGDDAASGSGSAEPLDGWRVANEPKRGTLTIGDLVCQTPEPDAAETDRQMVRVEIDRLLGAAKEGHLVTIECPFPAGTPVHFAGTAHHVGELSAGQVAALLRAALSRVPAVGAMKSVGFGRVEGFSVGEPETIALRPAAAAPNAPEQRIKIVYALDRPFLIDLARRGSNLHIGSDIIPGGAIKGTLAAAVKRLKGDGPAVNAFLEGLTVSHARPAPLVDGDPPEVRPELPLSLALCGERLVDLLLADPDPARWPPLADGKAAKFRPDWKDEDFAAVDDALYGGSTPPRPKREVRTRTAIDPVMGAAAYDGDDEAGMLFSDSAVRPDGFVWAGTITLQDKGDTRLFAEALDILAAGAPGLGKTGAVITATSIAAPEADSCEPLGDGLYALTLQTPALLNDLDALRQGKTVAEDYRDYFAGTGLGMTLVNHFARQRLAGGYIALRYPPRPDRYEPYLLTEPGSVFLVRPGSDQALQQVLRYGLPPRVSGSPTWRTCPFMRENGYGAVRANVVDHSRLFDFLAERVRP